MQPKENSSYAGYRRLWRDWLSEYRGLIFASFSLMIIAAIASAAYAKMIQLIIAAYEMADTSVIFWGPVGIVTISISKGISSYFQQVASNTALFRFEAKLKKSMYNKLIHADLFRLQGETPAAPELWGPSDWKAKTKSYRPQDENHFSNWIKRKLETNLKSRGIVVAREVEIRRGEGTAKGERTDIHVTAIVPEVSGGNFEQVQVIIEAKGCWNKDLKTAMKNQLVERYLKENQCRNGIYLVGWYVCDQWDNADYRRGRTPKWLLSNARDFFNQQSLDLSLRDLTIRSVVINTALR